MLRHPELLERIIAPARADLAPDLARHVLTLRFTDADRARYAELAGRAQDAPLDPDERAELEDFVTLADFLALLHAKAHASLRRYTPAA